jgi:flagellin
MTTFSVGDLMNQFVAIQALQGAGTDLGSLESQMATGLTVANPVDNGAAFAIAAGLRTDAQGLLAVQQGLGEARGVIGVAVQAATAVSNELIDLGKIALAATSPANTWDQLKVYAQQFDAGVAEIATIVQSASFNGTNLLGQDAQSVQVTSGTSGQTVTLPGIDLMTNVVDVLLTNSISAVIGGSGGSTTSNGTTLAQAEADLTGAITSTIPGATSATAQTFTTDLEAALGQTSADPTGSLTQLTSALNGNSFQDLLLQFTVGITLAVIGAGGNPTGLINAVVAQVNLLPPSGGGGGGSGGGGSGSGGTGGGSGGGGSGSLTLTDVLHTVNSVQGFVTSSLGELGAASSTVDAVQQFLSHQSDALATGLGALVDANLARDSARLTASRVAYGLALDSLNVTGERAKTVLLSLFKGALPSSAISPSPG